MKLFRFALASCLVAPLLGCLGGCSSEGEEERLTRRLEESIPRDEDGNPLPMRPRGAGAVGISLDDEPMLAEQNREEKEASFRSIQLPESNGKLQLPAEPLTLRYQGPAKTPLGYRITIGRLYEAEEYLSFRRDDFNVVLKPQESDARLASQQDESDPDAATETTDATRENEGVRNQYEIERVRIRLLPRFGRYEYDSSNLAVSDRFGSRDLFPAIQLLIEEPVQVSLGRRGQVLRWQLPTEFVELVSNSRSLQTTGVHEDYVREFLAILHLPLPAEPVSAGDTWSYQVQDTRYGESFTESVECELKGTLELQGRQVAVVEFVGAADGDVREEMPHREVAYSLAGTAWIDTATGQLVQLGRQVEGDFLRFVEDDGETLEPQKMEFRFLVELVDTELP